MAKRKRRESKQRKITTKYDLDIIIPVFGQAELLKECLEAIPDAVGSLDANIILVDDCGPDQDKLAEVYKNAIPNKRLVRHKQNMGYPRSTNTGVNAGKAPLILLLNSDCIPKKNAIVNMVKAFIDDPEVGVVGPKILFADGRWDNEGKIQHIGIAFNLNRIPFHPYIGWPEDDPKVNNLSEVQAVTGAALMTRREVWRKNLAIYKQYNDPTLGAMNEVYSPGTYEDVEYCLLARDNGYKVVYTPDATFRHYVGASSHSMGIGFPVGRNNSIFQARCGHIVQPDWWQWS